MAQAPHPEDNRLAEQSAAAHTYKGGDAKQAARAEKAAGATIPVNAGFWVLAGCVVVYLIALFLPFAGGVSGWQFVGVTEASASVQAKLTETVFLWLSLAGLGVLTTVALAPRRFVFAAPAWMLTTVALFASVLALWLRRTSDAFDQGFHHGPGSYLAILAVAVATFAFIPVITRRDAAQRAAGERRALLDDIDDVAKAQQEATRQAQGYSENPLLIDDRRARAAERHRQHPSD